MDSTSRELAVNNQDTQWSLSTGALYG